MRRLIAFLAAMCTLVPTALPQDGGKFSGLLFGDYYYVTQDHDKQLEGRNGFWIRRIYFTYDRAIAQNFAMRLRFEMNHPGDFSAGKAAPFVKDAYLKWDLGSHQLYLGVSPTPTFNVIEEIWGYRSVEKTPLDLQKMADSRDFGLALRGNLDAEGKVVYHAMLGNGSGVQSDSDSGKRLSLSVGFHPSPEITIELYGDVDKRSGENEDRSTLQSFFAYHTEAFRFGFQYARQRREGAREEVDLTVASAFAAGRLGEKLSGYVRIDRMFDPNPNGAGISYIPFDPSVKSTLLVVGLDYAVAPAVHLMPNVEIVTYSEGEDGTSPRGDVIPRMTFFYTF